MSVTEPLIEREYVTVNSPIAFMPVKEKRTVETALQIIKFVDKNGGLNKEKGSEYLKLLDIYPKPGRKMLIDIQNGQKAADIIKRNTE